MALAIQTRLIGTPDLSDGKRGYTFAALRLSFAGHGLCNPFDPRETLEIGWFAEHNLPEDLSEGHYRRISDAYRARHGDFKAYFDWE